MDVCETFTTLISSANESELNAYKNNIKTQFKSYAKDKANVTIDTLKITVTFISAVSRRRSTANSIEISLESVSKVDATSIQAAHDTTAFNVTAGNETCSCAGVALTEVIPSTTTTVGSTAVNADTENTDGIVIGSVIGGVFGLTIIVLGVMWFTGGLSSSSSMKYNLF